MTECVRDEAKVVQKDSVMNTTAHNRTTQHLNTVVKKTSPVHFAAVSINVNHFLQYLAHNILS